MEKNPDSNLGGVRLLLFSRFVTLGKPLLRAIVCRHH